MGDIDLSIEGPGQEPLITGPSWTPGDERGEIAVLKNKTFVAEV